MILLIAIKPEIKKLKEKISELKPEKTIVFGLNNENKVKAIIELNEIIKLNAWFLPLKNELNETKLIAEKEKLIKDTNSLNNWEIHFLHSIEEEKARVKLRENIRKRNSIILSVFKPFNEENTNGSKIITSVIEEKKPLFLIHPAKKYYEKKLNETIVVGLPEKSFLNLNIEKEIMLSELK